MKHLVIRKSYSCFYTDSNQTENDEANEKLEELQAALNKVLKEHNVSGEFGYSTFLNTEKHSICDCNKCNHVMVNRDKNPVGVSDNDKDINWVILDGGEYKGAFLCEECLPVTHRWSSQIE
jgi:hypothetical protein